MDIRKWFLKKLNKDNYMAELFLENEKLKSENYQLKNDILTIRKSVNWGMQGSPKDFADSISRNMEEKRKYWNEIYDLKVINHKLTVKIEKLEGQINEKCN